MSGRNIRLAKNLGEIIKASGMQRQDIAQALGVTPATITAYTNGRGSPSPENIRRLCQILDCRYEDLLGELD